MPPVGRPQGRPRTEQPKIMYPVLTLIFLWMLLALSILTIRNMIIRGALDMPGVQSEPENGQDVVEYLDLENFDLEKPIMEHPDLEKPELEYLDWEQNLEICRNPMQDSGPSKDVKYNSNLATASQVRMGKVTVHYGDIKPMYERALKTHELHNEIHGLSMFVLRQAIIDNLWNKPAYILSILLDEFRKPERERLEWLLWVDGDTIVLNPCISPSKFLPPQQEQDVHFIATRDCNGLNNGIFLLRVSEWNVKLFGAILGFRYYRPDVELAFTEQSAMEKLLLEEKFKPNVAYVPQRWFNSYYALQHDAFQDETLGPDRIRRGDFLLHFAGRGDRMKEMQYWLDIAERHALDWELDYVRTGYPDSVDAFWRSYKQGEESNKDTSKDK